MKRRLFAMMLGTSMTWCLGACKTPRQPETVTSDWEVLGERELAASHGKIDFVTQVKPVLEAKCVVCHNRKTLPFFSLETRQLAFAAPPRIVPGHPDKSVFITNGTLNHSKQMPPVGDRLTAHEKRIITAWVEQGAPWPGGPAGTLRPRVEPRP